jgi:hypothetical protein
MRIRNCCCQRTRTEPIERGRVSAEMLTAAKIDYERRRVAKEAFARLMHEGSKLDVIAHYY